MTAVAAWLRERGLRRVLLVSDPFHMFRLRLEARRTALEAYTSPTESSPISENPVLELRYLFAEGVQESRSRGCRSILTRIHLPHDPRMSLVSTERLYTGRIVNLDLDTRPLSRRLDRPAGDAPPPGRVGRGAVRRRPDGRRSRGSLLIRQFRHAADGFIWEVPAGRLDAGRDSRGLRRGASWRRRPACGPRRLERLTTIYTTPGFTDERIHLFLADGLEPGAGAPRGGRVHGAAHAALVRGAGDDRAR